MPEPTPTKPGRGAWTATGGLLPPLPGKPNRGYYYRPAYPGEPLVGSAGLKAGCTYNDAVVTEAVRAIQRLVLAMGEERDLAFEPFSVTGQIGDKTGAAIAAVQGHLGLVQDAIVGPKTIWCLVQPIIEATCVEYSLPYWALKGIALTESQGDLGAVGRDTPNDTGLMQMNRAAHPVTVRQAVDPHFCVDWTGRELAQRRDAYRDNARVDPILLAIAGHNSPKQAAAWAKAGAPPSKQIADYVFSVQKAGKS